MTPASTSATYCGSRAVPWDAMPRRSEAAAPRRRPRRCRAACRVAPRWPRSSAGARRMSRARASSGSSYTGMADRLSQRQRRVRATRTLRPRVRRRPGRGRRLGCATAAERAAWVCDAAGQVDAAGAWMGGTGHRTADSLGGRGDRSDGHRSRRRRSPADRLPARVAPGLLGRLAVVGLGVLRRLLASAWASCRLLRRLGRLVRLLRSALASAPASGIGRRAWGVAAVGLGVGAT